jgi:hypothetical protein
MKLPYTMNNLYGIIQVFRMKKLKAADREMHSYIRRVGQKKRTPSKMTKGSLQKK